MRYPKSLIPSPIVANGGKCVVDKVERTKGDRSEFQPGQLRQNSEYDQKNSQKTYCLAALTKAAHSVGISEGMFDHMEDRWMILN